MSGIEIELSEFKHEHDGDDEVEYAEEGNTEVHEVKPPGSAGGKVGTKLSPRKKIILANCLKLTLVICLFGLIASNLLLWTQYNQVKDLDEPSELEITQEYQTNLYASNWNKRADAMQDFFSYFGEISGYDFLSTPLVENYRLQTHIKGSNCTSQWDVEFRLRNYFYGPSANTSTFDAKIGDTSYNLGLIAPLEPSDDQLEHSFQKLEHDVHPCDNKYSRESRVQDIPYQPVFETCGDIHRYYPYMWDNSVSKVPVQVNAWEYWYTGVYSGTFDNGVLFKCDITIKYDTLDDIMQEYSNGNPSGGEFSLRIWSTHIGHGPWNQTSLDQIDGWYQKLLDKYGSSGDYPCK